MFVRKVILGACLFLSLSLQAITCAEYLKMARDVVATGFTSDQQRAARAAFQTLGNESLLQWQSEEKLEPAVQIELDETWRSSRNAGVSAVNAEADFTIDHDIAQIMRRLEDALNETVGVRFAFQGTQAIIGYLDLIEKEMDRFNNNMGWSRVGAAGVSVIFWPTAAIWGAAELHRSYMKTHVALKEWIENGRRSLLVDDPNRKQDIVLGIAARNDSEWAFNILHNPIDADPRLLVFYRPKEEVASGILSWLPSFSREERPKQE